MATETITIHALTPQRLPDWLDLFEQRAFTDHPEWRSCYCHFPHADHAAVVWQQRRGEDNRSASCARIQAGTMTGWLAYDGSRAIGWCNAGPRRFIEGLFDEPEPLAERIGAIACFVVAPTHRRRGVANALLGAACDGLRAAGFEWAEGYPRADATSDAASHHGPLAMYLAAGFAEFRRGADGSLTVRRRLHPRPL